MPIPVLMTNPCTPGLPELVAQEFELYRQWQDPEPAAESVRAVLTSYAKGASAEFIARYPNLEIIANYGVGYDSVDVAAARQRNIIVCNTPDVLTETVAEFALALLLAVARRVSAAERFVRSGQWGQMPFPLAVGLTGKRCGIVGLGRIGQAVARRAEAFGMQIAYHNRSQHDVPYRYEPSLVQLARDSDVLIIVVPGGDATRNLIDAEVLDALGSHGILINVARGSVVDEPALVEALLSGRLGGAGLDVFAREPQVPAALLDLDQVVLAPHLGSATVETRRAMGELCVANLRSYFAGHGALTPV